MSDPMLPDQPREPEPGREPEVEPVAPAAPAEPTAPAETAPAETVEAAETAPIDVVEPAEAAETAPTAPTAPAEAVEATEPVVEPEAGPVEPVVEPAAEPGAPEPAPAPVAPDAPVVADVPIAAAVSQPPSAQIPLAPADRTGLVPLEEVAPALAEASVSRRAFLGFGLAVAGGLAGAAALSRLVPVFAPSIDAAAPIVARYDPAGRAWTFVVDTSSCIGCGLCVVACKEENDVTEEAAFTRTWVERHSVAADGTIFVDSPEAGIHGFPPESTAPGAAGQAITASYFEPRLCMQCANSPCTQVCPVGATYRTEDGVILVDARRCIGCGYCVVACPYGARYLTPAGGENPNDTPGIADKCTWCYHRISRGGKPACVEVCPVGARQFGDAADPDSEIATLVRERNPRMLNPEYGTEPRVLYLGPSIEEA